MRDPERINKIIALLRDAWHTSPDQRLGQLIMNLAHPNNMWNLEDTDWESIIIDYLNTGKWRS
jgi:uncharacterized protein YihD (DUF1040 family)